MQNQEAAVAVAEYKAGPQRRYEIRRAIPEDLPAAFELVEEYFEAVQVQVRDSKAEFAKYLEDADSGIWLVFDREQPIGCIVLHPLSSMPGCGEVKRLYVRASYRKQGLADRLLGALETYARQLQYQWLYLDTKDDLDSAIRFYERNGYQRCERYNSNPQATIFMRKCIAGRSALPAGTGLAATDDRSKPVIRSFRPQDAAAFRQLNQEWITRYFRVEEKDSTTLENPSESILAPGGYIAMAFLNGEAVGCCALLRLEEANFEVAKMAVTPAAQGKGIGRKLLAQVIDEARRLGASRLYLETNSRLAPAIRLYESVGFRHVPVDRLTVSPYERANVYMELFLDRPY
jgi:putative acetyltransferase